MKVVVKEPKKNIKVVDINQKYRTDCVKEIIGQNYSIQFVCIEIDTQHILALGVIEDGLMRNLEPNMFISTTSPVFPVQILVGPVVFVKAKYENAFIKEIWDYEVEDITEEDLELIKQMVDPKVQAILYMKYMALQEQ